MQTKAAVSFRAVFILSTALVTASFAGEAIQLAKGVGVAPLRETDEVQIRELHGLRAGHTVSRLQGAGGGWKNLAGSQRAGRGLVT